MPVSDIYRQVTGRVGCDRDWIRIGKALATEYRARHPGQEPVEVERIIKNTTRMVKAYSTIEDPWIVDFVRQNID